MIAVATSRVPAFDHVYVVVMENHELGSIVGNPHAPYINRLIHDFGLATRYTAVAHPSQPNYVALFAGGPLGVHDNGVIHLTSRSVADQLEAAGKTWHVYAQDYPGGCSQLVLHYGPVDLVGAAGTYVRRHEPAISFTRISHDPARCSHITSLASFSATAADFELIVPNLTNDMHDGSVAQGDAFLKAFVPYITGSPAFATSLLVITWDEGSTKAGGGGRVPTIVISPLVSAGARSVVHHDHYSLLRTIETGLGMGCMRNTCAANDLGEFFAP
jgi:acid phosphatase